MCPESPLGPHTSRWCLAKANVCFLSWKWKTKLLPNEFTRLIPKGRGPRRGARDPGAPVLSYVAQLWRLATVTPAVDPRAEQNHPTPTRLRQRYRQDLGGYSIDDSALVPGPRSTGLSKMVQEPRARFKVARWGVFCHPETLQSDPVHFEQVHCDQAY